MLLCLGPPARAQSARDTTIELAAVAVDSPASLTLSWSASATAVNSLTVSRRRLGSPTWEAAVQLAATATSYSDTSVKVNDGSLDSSPATVRITLTSSASLAADPTAEPGEAQVAPPLGPQRGTGRTGDVPAWEGPTP